MQSLPQAIAQAAHKAHTDWPDAVVVVFGVNGICRYMSPNAETINGLAPAAVVGRHFSNFFGEADSAHIALALEDAILNGESVEIGREVISPTGGRQQMRGSARRIVDEDTGDAYVLSVGRRTEAAFG